MAHRFWPFGILKYIKVFILLNQNNVIHSQYGEVFRMFSNDEAALVLQFCSQLTSGKEMDPEAFGINKQWLERQDNQISVTETGRALYASLKGQSLTRSAWNGF